MAVVTKEEVDAIIDLLRHFPSDGQLFTGSRDPDRDIVAMNAAAMGFVEQRSSKKTCQACGHQRDDHHWHVISPAGRALLAFAGDA